MNGRNRFKTNYFIKLCIGYSLAVQWLGFGALTARGAGTIPGWGAKILQAVRHDKNK